MKNPEPIIPGSIYEVLQWPYVEAEAPLETFGIFYARLWPDLRRL